jgi:hypothetical protein
VRVPTADGSVFFKVVGPGYGFEPALTARLAALEQGRVPEVIAIDGERGWLLMRDGGRRLRELVQTAADLVHWERALPLYAELQLAMSPLADDLLELGVPDERLSKLPEHVRELIEEPQLLPEELATRARAALPAVEALVRDLAAFGIPATIQHDDLHDGQVFYDEGRYRFFDWGDSCVSHPFHTLTVTLRATAARLNLRPGGRELRRLLAAYLEPFDAPPEAAELAYRTGTLARSAAWQRHLRLAGARADPDDAGAPAYGLALFLAAGPLGSWRDPR